MRRLVRERRQQPLNGWTRRRRRRSNSITRPPPSLIEPAGLTGATRRVGLSLSRRWRAVALARWRRHCLERAARVASAAPREQASSLGASRRRLLSRAPLGRSRLVSRSRRRRRRRASPPLSLSLSANVDNDVDSAVARRIGWSRSSRKALPASRLVGESAHEHWRPREEGGKEGGAALAPDWPGANMAAAAAKQACGGKAAAR